MSREKYDYSLKSSSKKYGQFCFTEGFLCRASHRSFTRPFVDLLPTLRSVVGLPIHPLRSSTSSFSPPDHFQRGPETTRFVSRRVTFWNVLPLLLLSPLKRPSRLSFFPPHCLYRALYDDRNERTALLPSLRILFLWSLISRIEQLDAKSEISGPYLVYVLEFHDQSNYRLCINSSGQT